MFNTYLSRLTNNQLISSNIYLGDKCSLLNVKIKPYLMGYRNGYHILNISYTYLQVKIVIKLLVKLFLSRQKILVLKDLDFYKLSLSLNCKNIFFYDKK
jgi:ribosomal protein S2